MQAYVIAMKLESIKRQQEELKLSKTDLSISAAAQKPEHSPERRVDFVRKRDTSRNLSKQALVRYSPWLNKAQPT